MNINDLGELFVNPSFVVEIGPYINQDYKGPTNVTVIRMATWNGLETCLEAFEVRGEFSVIANDLGIDPT